ncbi:cell division protein ZapB [Pasteurella testudinis DSM 23072]|uniref:Cell division protein ZapB n=2 Tax=Pasteurellaceae TaxID=712 RepID=A0A4R3YB30_9PAST|nr:MULTISPECIES: cell division protein ZapB [Pasteurellaceae]TNG98753.1 cell division protein ZapB [Pasteurellaceae bacterium USgator41]TNH01043.1 cell division protein ZapB [Pasteurellaceae bacterium UScroc31]TNH02794.1 cell division protein ZapB [Pasteurellaceae bacterium USgator11]TNH03753.1 cell division protein ZapB [Pasteurellaceae bacterium Phil31]TNH09355.1 cell division protein ZapB [Pasteurellaceae bacterium Phil11]
MSFELLEQLDEKIKQAVETIQLQQLEIEELKGKHEQVQNELNHLRGERDALAGENDHLKNEHNNWQERLRSLLGKIDNV